MVSWIESISLLLEQAALFGPFVFGALGLLVGSYLNATALRWNKNKFSIFRRVKSSFSSDRSPLDWRLDGANFQFSQWLKNRSHCPYCDHVLGWQELVPLLSFIIQAGKCKHCRRKISWRYPLVEIITALIFASIVAVYGINLQVMMLLMVASIMIILSLIDFEHQILPDRLTLPALAGVILYLTASHQSNLLILGNGGQGIGDSFWIGLAIGTAWIGAIVLTTGGRGMGIGDIKLAALMGATLGGPKTLIALLLAFIIGALAGVILIVSKKATCKTAIAFGPFLALGWLIAVLWGDWILMWYNYY